MRRLEEMGPRPPASDRDGTAGGDAWGTVGVRKVRRGQKGARESLYTARMDVLCLSPLTGAVVPLQPAPCGVQLSQVLPHK